MPVKPPLRERIKNLAGSVGRAAVAAAHGSQIKADAIQAGRRLEICSRCPQSIPVDVDVRSRSCSMCGCAMAKKVLVATDSCPRAHW